MSFHESTLLGFPCIQKTLGAVLRRALEQMTSDEIAELESRQSVMFERSPLVNLRALLDNQGGTIIPIGLLDAPQTPRTYIGVITEVQLDWVIDPATPRLSIPLPVIFNATVAPNNVDTSNGADGTLATGMIRLVRTLLAMRLFVHRLITDNYTTEANLDVVFYVEAQAAGTEARRPSPVSAQQPVHAGIPHPEYSAAFNGTRSIDPSFAMRRQESRGAGRWVQ